MSTDSMFTRTYSDTALVEQALKAEAERKHIAKVFAAPPPRKKIVNYTGTMPVYKDDQSTFFGTLFAVFK